MKSLKILSGLVQNTIGMTLSLIHIWMDNRKSDELYKDVLNQSDCMNMKFSHVHENGRAESYQSPKMNQTRKREEEKQKDSVAQKTKNQKAKYESAFQYKSTDAYTQRTFVQNQKQGKKSAGLILTIGFVVVGVICLLYTSRCV